MIHNALRLATGLLALSASTPALAETRLDTTSSATWRSSIAEMAVECDGQPRGPCFLKLLEASKKISQQYFDRYLKGVSGSSPAYQARYKEMEAAKNKEMSGLTRAELLGRAAALK